jgi:hypothetical protein
VYNILMQCAGLDFKVIADCDFVYHAGL